MNKHLETIIALLGEQVGYIGEDWDEDSTIADCGIDSLDLSDFAIALEDEYDVVADDEDIAGWRTLGDICKFLEAGTADMEEDE